MFSLKFSYIFIAFFFFSTKTCLSNPLEQTQTPSQQQQQQQKVFDDVKDGSTDFVSQSPEKVSQDPVGNSQDGTREQRSYSPKENDIEKPYSQVEESLLQKLNLKCSQREPTSCAMLKLITYMNRLFKKANIDITENIEITQTSAVAEVKAVITSNPDSNGNLNLAMSLNKISPDNFEGRKKNKGMGGILALMAMKAGMAGALALKGLALLVGKALVVAKLALLLAAIIGLKKLFHQEKHVTYEVVAQPHHTHSHVEHVEHGHGGGGGGHDSYSSGWGRSATDVGKHDAHNMAYRSYIPKN
ncbi:conserved hypothetical protein [Pediculus humanus corporis]|uniref:Osiris n=1 Tax=Pediculus humanus subsp. corporis TaxID=121224 RepID=E0VA35_PEDHC|nr:uncharacterized protein Phum_PHUM026160 [Pediculus humanus corporis]EEB10241.1 conserved hypothetical protein [Pediculus humanus corporis]